MTDVRVTHLKHKHCLNGNDEMPIKRKICKIGNSFAIFLPKSWVMLLEAKHGKIRAVTMEVDGQLIINPILKEENKHECVCE
jgi:antitoxin component of MazEF toxin-antitoxin module